MRTLIQCPYCKTQIVFVAPLVEGEEKRENCQSCGARVGLQLKTFRRGQPKARRDENARARKLVGKTVQLVREIRSSRYVNDERPVLALAGTVLTVRNTEGSTLFLSDKGKAICRAQLTDVREYP